ncbi:MAG: CoA ester lyase [Desulfobacterales bacterium]|jgi:citrate lyase subunit beta/citryl-CoA lyase
MTSMIRSVLFVPGNQPERINKAVATAADAVILDLEDAVPIDDKNNARDVIKKALPRHRHRRLWVRVNGPDTRWIWKDIDAVTVEGIGGIMIPKLESPDQVSMIYEHLSKIIQKRAIDLKDFFFIPLIETALSVENAYRIALSAVSYNNKSMLAFGAADFTTDMGVNLSNTGEELRYPRARVAIACRAASGLRPLDTPYMIDIKDRDGLRKDAQRARDLGFQGKLCVHPVQVEVVNDVFSPTETEIDFAKRVLAAYEAAIKDGKAAVQLDGKFIDPPVVERARQIIEWENSLPE